MSVPVVIRIAFFFPIVNGYVKLPNFFTSWIFDPLQRILTNNESSEIIFGKPDIRNPNRSDPYRKFGTLKLKLYNTKKMTHLNF